MFAMNRGDWRAPLWRFFQFQFITGCHCRLSPIDGPVIEHSLSLATSPLQICSSNEASFEEVSVRALSIGNGRVWYRSVSIESLDTVAIITFNTFQCDTFCLNLFYDFDLNLVDWSSPDLLQYELVFPMGLMYSCVLLHKSWPIWKRDKLFEQYFSWKTAVFFMKLSSILLCVLSSIFNPLEQYFNYFKQYLKCYLAVF